MNPLANSSTIGGKGYALGRYGVEALGHLGVRALGASSGIRMSYQPIKELELFKLYEEVADWVWDSVNSWKPLAVDTIGKQVIRSIDSIGANLVEGDGRGSDADAIRFFIYARGSARESRLWIQRASKRKLIEESLASQQLEKLKKATQLLNLLIRYRRNTTTSIVREEQAQYRVSRDPYTEDVSHA